MTANGSRSDARAGTLAAALFAITLNFLQPLAHAAILRDGAPRALWTAICESTAADPGSKSERTPSSAAEHECCLGLAHAPAIADPPQNCIDIVEPTFDIVRFVVTDESDTPPVQPRRPSQPRAPPPNS